MNQVEVAKNLLSGKSCQTCWRSGTDCGERLSNIEANQTCKEWSSYSEAALRKKIVVEKMIEKWKNLSDSDLWKIDDKSTSS